MDIRLHNKQFKALQNSDNGEVSNQTIFNYFQEGDVVWAKYAGGDIVKGFLIGTLNSRQLRSSYQHLNSAKEIMTGNCISNIELHSDGRIILNENWEWTCKDFSKGSSTLIEI